MTTALIVSNIVLWVAVLVLGILVFALMRQVGILHDRLPRAGALSLSGGLKVGEAMPAMPLDSLTGGSVTLGGPGHDKATLIAFTAPNCPVCGELTEMLKAIAQQEKDWLRLVFASDGPLEEHQDYIIDKGLERFPYVVSRELGVAFEVAKLPYMGLVDREGIVRAKGLANTREHVESLFYAMEAGVGSLQEYLQKHRDEHEATTELGKRRELAG